MDFDSFLTSVSDSFTVTVQAPRGEIVFSDFLLWGRNMMMSRTMNRIPNTAKIPVYINSFRWSTTIFVLELIEYPCIFLLYTICINGMS